MTPTPYIYALLNGYISCEDFVNWAFESFEENTSDKFDSDLTAEIKNCNCEDNADIARLKMLLTKRFEKELSNADPSCLTECNDLPLKLMLIYSSAASKLCIDFHNVSNADELHKRLKYAFHLPHWYGENLNAFADLAALSGYKIIVLFNFTSLKNKLPDIAEQLLKIFDDEKDFDSIIITT